MGMSAFRLEISMISLILLMFARRHLEPHFPIESIFNIKYATERKYTKFLFNRSKCGMEQCIFVPQMRCHTCFRIRKWKVREVQGFAMKVALKGSMNSIVRHRLSAKEHNYSRNRIRLGKAHLAFKFEPIRNVRVKKKKNLI